MKISFPRKPLCKPGTVESAWMTRRSSLKAVLASLDAGRSSPSFCSEFTAWTESRSGFRPVLVMKGGDGTLLVMKGGDGTLHLIRRRLSARATPPAESSKRTSRYSPSYHS